MPTIWRLALALLCDVALCGAAVPVQAGTYRLVYSLPGYPNAANPAASLIDVGGTLYGTTANGGTDNAGTVFAFNPATGDGTVVYSFKGGTDGSEPLASLIESGGFLYGTTGGGGMNGYGTVFSVDPATGAEAIVHRFTTHDGVNPQAGLIRVGRRLFGTTSAGGKYHQGTVFSVNPGTGAIATLHAFDTSDGSLLFSGLLGLDGKLYGVTYLGGIGNGVVFSLDPKTRAETTLYSFNGGSDGKSPTDSLIDVNGTLYGTTFYGGAGGRGTVFSVAPLSGEEKVIYSFQGIKDGADPETSVLHAHDKLYGTTLYGGSKACDHQGCGTLFAVSPATGTEKVLHSFKGGGDGEFPAGGLIDVGGTFYGTTGYGGANNAGTVFSYTP